MTKISWTDETWNPVTGCSKLSSGCANCYAAAMAPRLAAMGAKGYTNLPWTAANSAENVALHTERMTEPLRWRSKPRRVFTCSMADLFHERVPDDFLDKVFAVMALASDHTFQVLTKRTERMRDYLSNPLRHALVDQLAFEFSRDELGTDPDARNWPTIRWPLNNVWLGASVEDQRAAEQRIHHLLQSPAALRFLSCEPLLGPVGLQEVRLPNGFQRLNAITGRVKGRHPDSIGQRLFESVDWVIAGGESGPNHRDMDEDWARRLRDDCGVANVPFFFKQHSANRPEQDPYLDGRTHREIPPC